MIGLRISQGTPRIAKQVLSLEVRARAVRARAVRPEKAASLALTMCTQWLMEILSEWS